MNLSAPGRQWLEGLEGLRLSAYADSKGVPTIGYGHTAGVRLGDTCSQAQADAWLAQDVATAEQAVNAGVHVRLSQNQFDALVSFAFNVGASAFHGSTLLRLLNVGNYATVPGQLMRWCKGTIRGVPVIVPGLVHRRAAEVDRWNQPAEVTA